MKSQQQWFNEYAISHQNKTNKLIHYICVPAIFFSIIGLFMSINTHFLESIFRLNLPQLENWGTVLLFFMLCFFYLRLSYGAFIKMLIFSFICILGNFYLASVVPLFYTSILVFSIAWIGQFYGHHLEGKKPSFLKDLQFLLIGPLWVLEKIFKAN